MRRFLPVAAFASTLVLASLGAVLSAQTPNPAVRGKQVFAVCAACHSVSASGPARLGPHLQGVVGRRSGAVAGFKYSAALKGKNLVWTEANLDRFLTRPAAMVPGTTMTYAGVANPADRKALIAYLKKPVP